MNANTKNIARINDSTIEDPGCQITPEQGEFGILISLSKENKRYTHVAVQQTANDNFWHFNLYPFLKWAEVFILSSILGWLRYNNFNNYLLLAYSRKDPICIPLEGVN